MNVGENIRKFRLEKGLTQKQIADSCGMADSAIRKYESGKVVPKYETLKRIATALGVEPWELMGYDGSIRVHEPGTDLLPAEFNEFENFIESMGYYTRYDKASGNYRLHKGKVSVSITPGELQRLVRTSKATVSALVQDLIEDAPQSTLDSTEGQDTTPTAKPTEGPQECE